MSTKVNKKLEFHLSKETRLRLSRLSRQLIWLLDTDAKEGFKESDLSYRLGPWLFKALMLVWCRPIKAVKKKFSYLGGVDCPCILVNLESYKGLIADNNRLCRENRVYYNLLLEHGLVKKVEFTDDLPF